MDKCMKCKADMVAKTLSSSEVDTPVHEHHICSVDETHPVYCVTYQMWINK